MEPKEGKGLRYNANKLRIELVPVEWTVELARVMTAGSYKYAPNNWLLGMDYSKMDGCLSRHWHQYRAGNDIDPDTKCHHLALVAWNALALLTYHMRGIGVDPRSAVFLYDDNFMPTQGTYAYEMDVGLTEAEIEVMKTKYAHLREPKI